MASKLKEQILLKAAREPEGTPVTAKEFLHLGSRAAIDQTLSRLAKSGRLLRAAHGLYFRPVEGKFGTRPPEASKAIAAYAAHSGETVVPNEAAAANAFGLTTQVPARRVYLTSGASRRLKLGKQVIELKHAPSWRLALPNGAAGQALRALYWGGEERAPAVAREIRKRLPASQLKELAQLPVRKMPAWAAREIASLGRYA